MAYDRWDAENRDALRKLLHARDYLNPQADAAARAILDNAWQTLSEEFEEKLLWRSLPRGEDR